MTTRLVKPTMLQIVKSIPDSERQTGDGHGNPTFIFKITGEGSGKVWYKSVTFGDEAVSDGWSFSKENGRWIARTAAEEFPDDTYSVEEISVSRFKLTGSDIYRSGNFKRFTFENEKDNWGYFGHKSVVINTLKGGLSDAWK